MLPEEMTHLMSLATSIPPIARAALTIILILVGACLLFVAIWRLVRGANRLSSLRLAAGHNGPAAQTKDIAMANRS